MEQRPDGHGRDQPVPDREQRRGGGSHPGRVGRHVPRVGPQVRDAGHREVALPDDESQRRDQLQQHRLWLRRRRRGRAAGGAWHLSGRGLSDGRRAWRHHGRQDQGIHEDHSRRSADAGCPRRVLLPQVGRPRGPDQHRVRSGYQLRVPGHGRQQRRSPVAGVQRASGSLEGRRLGGGGSRRSGTGLHALHRLGGPARRRAGVGGHRRHHRGDEWLLRRRHAVRPLGRPQWLACPWRPGPERPGRRDHRVGSEHRGLLARRTARHHLGHVRGEGGRVLDDQRLTRQSLGDGPGRLPDGQEDAERPERHDAAAVLPRAAHPDR